MIGIRADANETVATGHIMRCITIAQELIRLGEEVIFFTADDGADELLDNAAMKHVCLDSDWENPEGEIPVLAEQIQTRGIDRLLVDSYRMTYDYFKAMSRICKTIYIDDLAECTYPVDMLINYNGYHDLFPYESNYENTHGHDEMQVTKLLLGPSYVPLREQFRCDATMEKSGDIDFARARQTCNQVEASLSDTEVEQSAKAKQVEHEATTGDTEAPKKTKVLLSVGGGDIHKAMLAILQSAKMRPAWDSYEWHVVVGSFLSNKASLESFADSNANVHIHERVTDMAGLMRSCDMAISAAGTMLYELAATRVPTIFIVTADNQKYDSEYFEKNNTMIGAGDIRTNRLAVINRTLDCIDRLRTDAELYNKMKEALKQVTDGNGAVRIAEEIVRL